MRARAFGLLAITLLDVVMASAIPQDRDLLVRQFNPNVNDLGKTTCTTTPSGIACPVFLPDHSTISTILLSSVVPSKASVSLPVAVPNTASILLPGVKDKEWLPYTQSLKDGLNADKSLPISIPTEIYPKTENMLSSSSSLSIPDKDQSFHPDDSSGSLSRVTTPATATTSSPESLSSHIASLTSSSPVALVPSALSPKDLPSPVTTLNRPTSDFGSESLSHMVGLTYLPPKDRTLSSLTASLSTDKPSSTTTVASSSTHVSPLSSTISNLATTLMVYSSTMAPSIVPDKDQGTVSPIQAQTITGFDKTTSLVSRPSSSLSPAGDKSQSFPPTSSPGHGQEIPKGTGAQSGSPVVIIAPNDKPSSTLGYIPSTQSGPHDKTSSSGSAQTSSSKTVPSVASFSDFTITLASLTTITITLPGSSSATPTNGAYIPSPISSLSKPFTESMPSIPASLLPLASSFASVATHGALPSPSAQLPSSLASPPVPLPSAKSEVTIQVAPPSQSSVLQPSSTSTNSKSDAVPLLSNISIAVNFSSSPAPPVVGSASLGNLTTPSSTNLSGPPALTASEPVLSSATFSSIPVFNPSQVGSAYGGGYYGVPLSYATGPIRASSSTYTASSVAPFFYPSAPIASVSPSATAPPRAISTPTDKPQPPASGLSASAPAPEAPVPTPSYDSPASSPIAPSYVPAITNISVGIVPYSPLSVPGTGAPVASPSSLGVIPGGEPEGTERLTSEPAISVLTTVLIVSPIPVSIETSSVATVSSGPIPGPSSVKRTTPADSGYGKPTITLPVSSSALSVATGVIPDMTHSGASYGGTLSIAKPYPIGPETAPTNSLSSATILDLSGPAGLSASGAGIPSAPSLAVPVIPYEAPLASLTVISPGLSSLLNAPPLAPNSVKSSQATGEASAKGIGPIISSVASSLAAPPSAQITPAPFPAPPTEASPLGVPVDSFGTSAPGSTGLGLFPSGLTNSTIYGQANVITTSGPKIIVTLILIVLTLFN